MSLPRCFVFHSIIGQYIHNPDGIFTGNFQAIQPIDRLDVFFEQSNADSDVTVCYVQL